MHVSCASESARACERGRERRVSERESERERDREKQRILCVYVLCVSKRERGESARASARARGLFKEFKDFPR